MRIKRYLSVLFVLVSLVAAGQVQKGYVKTKGTASKRGERLNGVTVSVRGGSSVVSAGKGEFSFNVPGKNFSFSSVSKNGYVLTDRDFLGRNFVHSSEWKVIVMEKPEQRAQEVKAIKEQVKKSLEADIKKKEAEIARLEKEGKKSAAEIRKLKQQLYNAIDANEKLVEEMAERFVSIDYDQMDEVNRRATELILNGELEKAKTLLDSQGDISEIINDVNKKKEEALKAQNHAADLCYNKYNLFLLQHQNDSAAYYLEKRTLLDTTNVQWQLEAGTFYKDYLAQYDKAKSFFETALLHALKNGERNADVATCYDKIGSVFHEQSNDTKALEYYKKTLEIRKEIYGERHPAVAESYNNIGVIRVNYIDTLVDTTFVSGVPSTAYEYLNKALEINKEFYGERHPAVAVSYDNLGFMYYYQHKIPEMLECYNKSLEINKEVYGERHPAVATCYRNIGFVLEKQENYAEALEYYKKSLEIREEVFVDNFDVHDSRIRIGDVLDAQGKYSEALEYYKKASGIDKYVDVGSIDDVNNIISDDYISLGSFLLQKDDHYYSEALMCFQKALEIYNELDDWRNRIGILDCYEKIGYVHSKQGKYAEALEYYPKALEYYPKALEYCNDNVEYCFPFIFVIFESIGDVFHEQGKYSEALEYYNKALEIYKEYYINLEYFAAGIYNKIGELFHEQGKYSEALEYYQKALDLYTVDYDPEHPETKRVEENIKKLRAVMGE